MERLKKYIPVIGLEIHVELCTKSKMFCQCRADWFGKAPNSITCPVCLGLPGALPVPNKKAVEWTMLLGLAMSCKIQERSKFDRKHYFYPDLPKGYQISQYDNPIAVDGRFHVKCQMSNVKCRIRRVHLEEDTGKLIHKGKETLVDFNRSGVPLLEIVTEPDFRSSEEVKIFLQELRTLVRYLKISDADMEKGSMRLEPNISLREMKNEKSKSIKEIEELPDYKVEIKNINSFRFAKRAIDFEIERQKRILLRGGKPFQETRGWDEKRNITVSQRTKEEATDYRYFPEPDIPTMYFEKKKICDIKKNIPELPSAKRQRYIKDFHLAEDQAQFITADYKLTQVFEEYAKNEDKSFAKKAANVLKNKGHLIKPEDSVNKAAKNLKNLVNMLYAQKDTDKKILKDSIEIVLKENAKAESDFKKGKTNIIMFLIGQVMSRMKGKADAREIRRELERKLK